MINSFLDDVPQQENESRNKKQSNIDAGTAFMRRIGEVGFLEPCILSDEDLGNLDLVKVMPDTWNNVPWTVTNSIEVLKHCCLSQRRLLEQVKSYSI